MLNATINNMVRMFIFLYVLTLECAQAMDKGSSQLHDLCSNPADGSSVTSSHLQNSNYMSISCHERVPENHTLSLLKLLETLQWNQVIVFYDQDYGETELQLLPTNVLTTTYDLTDLHTSFQQKQLLHQLHKKFFPRLNFLLLSNYSRALQLLQEADRFDLDSNRSTEFRHHSFWVVSLYCPLHPIIRTLPAIYHLENVVVFVSDKNGSTDLHRLVTTPGRRSFTASDLIEIKDEVFPNTRYGLNNRTLVVSTLLYEPFVMKKEERIEGYLIDILDAIASTLNFSYEIVHPDDESYGEVVDGRWNGFIGQLERREVDLVVAALTIHEDREKVMDFLYPPVYNWMDDIMFRLQPDETKVWQIYIKPFSDIVLLTLFVALSVTTGIGCILTRQDNAHTGKGGNSWRSLMSTLMDTFFYMFGILILRGLETHKKKLSTRLLLFAWGVFSVIIAACYSANLVASFAVQKPKLPFTSLEEMVRQTEYKWGFESGTIKQHIFNGSKSGNMKLAWEGVLQFNQTDPDVLNVADSVHIDKVNREKYATVIFRYRIEKLRRQDCSIHYVGQDIIWHQLGIGVPTDYPLKRELEDILYVIADSGLLDTWWRRWSKRKDDHCIEDRGVNTLQFSDVASGFYLLCGGLGVAVFVLVMEVLLRSVKHVH